MTENGILKEELITRFKNGLNLYQLNEARIEREMYGLRTLLFFMEKENFTTYTQDVKEKYVQHLKQDESTSNYSKNRRLCFIHLLETILNNKPYSRRTTKNVTYTFPGDIGSIAKLFIRQLRIDERLSVHTITQYENVLSHFAKRMQMDNVSIELLCRHDILSFVSSSQNVKAYLLMHLRRFLSYLYENEHTKEDFSQLFIGIKPKRKEKLPSYYDINEVSKIEKAVERTSAIGKRNYAMILLASRLGLRSSDVRGLKFSNLDWDNNLISMQQYKTKRYITLPLLSDVGDALIDYITNGRPRSSLKNVFVSSSQPYREMHSSTFSSVVARYIYSSGIDYKGKHVGSHTLRHSLATLLLKEGTGLPVISETLGHASTETTMYYLGVDTNSLLECSLEVPIVDASFYLQKGGLLYD